jgi:type II secretion system protein D
VKRLSLAILLLAGGVAFAQNVPPQPRPLVQPPAPAAAPAVPQVPGTGNTTRLQFPNTDVKEVLNFYGLATKKRLVVDNQVQGTVNIVVAGEVPIEEAVRIIEINLLLNGFTLVPVEGSNIVKVVGSGKNPRSAAIPIISDELLIPEGEQVVTYLAKLRYADPTELQQMLSTYVAPAPGGYTNITALPKSQALLITENSATIRGVLRILHTIDVPPAEVISEFIPLERADASDILEKLTAIFEKKDAATTGTPRSAQRPPGAPGNAGAPGVPPIPGGVTGESTAPGTLELRNGALSEDSIIVGKIKLTADVRTNRIHVVTRPVNLPFVRKLITEFDATAVFGEPVARPLRFVSVGDVLDVVVKAISEPGAKEDGSSTGTASRAAPGSTANRGNTGFGSGGASGTDGGSGSEFNVSEGLSTEAVDTTPEARVVGTTKIIADKNANAIIVIGSADARAKVFRLLDHLDQRIPQVMLHTVIGELNLNEREQFGVEYILRSAGLGGLAPLAVNANNVQNAANTGNDGTGTGISTGTTNNTTTTNNTNTTTAGNVATARRATDLVDLTGGRPALNFNNLLNQDTVRAVAAAGAGGLTGFVTAGNSMTAVVTALEDTNRFRVVSRPSVFTRNNKKAIIASGQEIAVPTSIQSSLNGSNNVNQSGIVTSSSVQFKRVALQLEVVPLINSEREVSLDILQKVDEVSGSTRIDNNDIPNIATRYVKTSVSVPNEGTLVLGGLIKQSQNRSRSGIPYLMNIPVLGYLFSTTTKEKIRTELVILIRPVVSWAPPESIQIRERAQEFMNMDPDLEATLFPAGVRKAAATEMPVATPIPVKRAQPASTKRKPATPVPAKRASANTR